MWPARLGGGTEQRGRFTIIRHIHHRTAEGPGLDAAPITDLSMVEAKTNHYFLLKLNNEVSSYKNKILVK